MHYSEEITDALVQIRVQEERERLELKESRNKTLCELDELIKAICNRGREIFNTTPEIRRYFYAVK